MRVVRDDPRGLIGWLAPGTRRVELRDPDGAGPRDVPLARRFHADRSAAAVGARVWWRGPGVLRIAPAERPWSVLVFWSEDDTGGRSFAGWYVNLENPGHREGADLVTTDQILDIWIEPDGSVTWKDEDELVAAVDQGRYTAAQATTIRENGTRAVEEFRSHHWVFDPEWTRWEAPREWTVPDLSPEITWVLDLTAPNIGE